MTASEPDPVSESVCAAAAGAGLRKRSITVAGHRTSVSVEKAFWEVLKIIARREGVSLHALIARIDRDRQGNLSSALRTFALAYLRRRAGL